MQLCLKPQYRTTQKSIFIVFESSNKRLNCLLWKWSKIVQTKKMKILRFCIFKMKVKKMVSFTFFHLLCFSILCLFFLILLLFDSYFVWWIWYLGLIYGNGSI
ncbi:hypothetical protein ES332_A11G174500v1 [Gossypium tomentosum]|uniref:Uncharacterized protein n=1 Tax=Gossypium tomentosum TaxID=34277 RepID=A0A5D2NBM5_GOSTO|nr:hypothetical protein ES332_A11G174500v1 [Gossypium tomentosum]